MPGNYGGGWLTLVLPGVKRRSEMLWLSGVSRLTLRLSPDFWQMLKTKNNSQLNQWFIDISQSGLVDLQRVAAGMEADTTAIHEAISSRWSNGVVEGHVNRLKILKRQMYGRAGFELLRRRVMSPLA